MNKFCRHNIVKKSISGKNIVPCIRHKVLIKDDTNIPRGQWRLSKVIELIVGRRGSIHKVKLTVISKIGTRASFQRPAQKIIQL